MRFSVTTLLVIPIYLVGLASGQDCALQLGAWEAYPPERVNVGGVIQRRKATVNGFSATAVNQATKKAYKSFSLLGNIYFEDMPEGLYKITIRKPGFKSLIQTHEFSCRFARDGISFVDLLLTRGSSSQIEQRGRDRYTVRGDIDYTPSPPSTTERPIPKTISGGVLNRKATSLPKPTFPAASWPKNAAGIVSVQVLIDEEGHVISALAISGHPALRPSATNAARAAKFPVTLYSGQAVRVSGVITYTVVPN